MHLDEECLQEGRVIELSPLLLARRMDREGVTACISASEGGGGWVHLRIPCSCHCRDTRLECSCPAAPSYSPLVPARSDVPTRDPWLQQSWKKEANAVMRHDKTTPPVNPTVPPLPLAGFVDATLWRRSEREPRVGPSKSPRLRCSPGIKTLKTKGWKVFFKTPGKLRT